MVVIGHSDVIEQHGFGLNELGSGQRHQHNTRFDLRASALTLGTKITAVTSSLLIFLSLRTHDVIHADPKTIG